MTSSSPCAAPLPGALDARAGALMTVLCLLWALQQISLKAIAGDASPMLVVALRSFIALVLLALLMRRRGEAPSRANLKPGALAGALFALEFLLVALALQLTAASHVVVFLYTAPIFAALGLHWRLPAERLAPLQWAGIALAFGGIVLAFLGGAHADGTRAVDAQRALLGDALALLAGVAWGATTVTIRFSALSHAPATETLFFQLLGAFVLLLPAAASTGQWHLEPSLRVLAHIGFQSLVVSFASFLAWFWLLRRTLAAQLGVFSFLTPLFGVVLGALLLGETLDRAFIGGSALVLAGIAIVGSHALLARRFAAWRAGSRRAPASAGTSG